MDSTVRPVLDAASVLDRPIKASVCQSKTLLIDDSDKNVDSFRKCGGHAVLVPRPWNSLHGFNALDHLTTAFYSLFGE